jgi:hypothetical protein
MNTHIDIRIGSADDGKLFFSSFDNTEPEFSHKLRIEMINEAYEEWNKNKSDIFMSINSGKFTEISIATFLYYKDMFENDYKKYLENKVPYKESYEDMIHNRIAFSRECFEAELERHNFNK